MRQSRYRSLLTRASRDRSFEPHLAPISPGEQVKVIEPSRGWAPLKLGTLWLYRGLLYFFAWRDVKVRYKQTVFGAAWAIVKPAVTMLIFTVIFGHFAKIPSDGVPYALFSYCALVPWTYFSTVVGQASTSLVGNASLISKVYFPRLLLPLSSASAGLVDLGIAFLVLIAMLPFFHVRPTITLLLLPLFVLLAIAATVGVGVWLAALNVQFRDVGHVVPFLTQIWLYVTPIAYPASFIHGRLSLFVALNPMSSVVEGFRWAILGRNDLTATMLGTSVTISLLILISGLFYFRRVESRFADVI